jgi:hypothetical protein
MYGHVSRIATDVPTAGRRDDPAVPRLSISRRVRSTRALLALCARGTATAAAPSDLYAFRDNSSVGRP